MTKTKLTIEFDNPKAAEHFQRWLDGEGEQHYWVWMEYREREEGGDITALRFNYDLDKHEIKTECGRLDE